MEPTELFILVLIGAGCAFAAYTAAIVLDIIWHVITGMLLDKFRKK